MNGASASAHLAEHNRRARQTEARRLVEGTTLSQGVIASRTDVSPSTLSSWKRRFGWQRPQGAPEPPPLDNRGRDLDLAAKRREKMIERLFRVFDRQLMDIETRACTPGAATEEKDARVLGTLARTLGTLMTLGRGDGDQPDDPEAEAVDPDEIRAKIAQRLFGLGKGGTEP
jgi:hypothetical protein